MRELQDPAEHLWRENDRLWAQVEKRHYLGENDVQDNSQPRHSTAYNKGKKPIVPDNMDTSANYELSSGRLPDLSLVKSSKARPGQRRSHCPTFSNADSGTFF